ncbi:hypothetical protein PAPHI01_2780, partial [Pancytospora philotis]
PDLNLIENVWADVKRRYDGLTNKPTDPEELKRVIAELWYATDPELIRELYRSMRRRLEQVIRARGGNTTY